MKERDEDLRSVVEWGRPEIGYSRIDKSILAAASFVGVVIVAIMGVQFALLSDKADAVKVEAIRRDLNLVSAQYLTRQEIERIVVLNTPFSASQERIENQVSRTQADFQALDAKVDLIRDLQIRIEANQLRIMQDLSRGP